jgi:hypothetical protein
MKVKINKNMIPTDGVVVSASKGNKITRIHLDMAQDGITLAMVGAAAALKNPSDRHSLTLQNTSDGITLAMVGAATASVTPTK